MFSYPNHGNKSSGEKRVRSIPVLCLFLLVALISSCNDQGEEPDDRLLFWHSLGDRDAAVLYQILDDYEDLHPNVSIVREHILAGEIHESYEQRVAEGLGPDMMLIADYRLYPLLAQGLIRDMTNYDIDLSSYDPEVLGQVRYQDRLIGLPFSTFTQVLCYNQEQIKNPPTTLDDLIADADAGHRIGHQTGFSQLAWIMPALGGSFFNDDNRVEVDADEVVLWLEWLLQASKHPNVILSPDIGQLKQAFISGDLAYLVCPSELIPGLHDALGGEKLAVAILPAQPGNIASAYFSTDAIVFNPAADPGSITQGIRLAQFLTNPAKQMTLALETQSQIPANINVDIDDRLAPLEATLLAQSKTATSLDFIELEFKSLTLAEPYLQGVLDGEIEPSQAAADLTRQINDLWRTQD